MVCSYCKSDNFFIKDAEDKTGLYCQNCGRWLKWLSDDEVVRYKEEIAKRKRAITIDGADYEIVKEKLRDYKKRYEKIQEELKFFKQNSASSAIQAKAMYEKALKLKDITSKIAAYDEVLVTLRLK